jgi:hypothetical protein
MSFIKLEETARAMSAGTIGLVLLAACKAIAPG